MRTGIYGGTFDPVHLGHITMLEKAMAAAKLDRAIVMPDRIPPHKASDRLVRGEHRLKMCELAFGEMENVKVSDWELSQQGKSYSVLTMRHLKEELSGDKLFFIMGSDMLMSFHKWYCFEELLGLCTLVCVSRQQGDLAQLEDKAAALEKAGGEVIIARAKAFEVSSSQLREMLMKGEDCSQLISERVLKYIRTNGLYR